MLEGPKDPISCIATKENYVFGGGEEKIIHVWLKNSKFPNWRLEGHKGWVNGLALDDQKLYSASFDKTILVWDLKSLSTSSQTVKPEAIWQQHTSSVEAICVDKTNVYSGSADGTVIVWDKTGKPLNVQKKHSEGVSCIFVDDKKLYTGSYDNTSQIWSKDVRYIHRHVSYYYADWRASQVLGGTHRMGVFRVCA